MVTNSICIFASELAVITGHNPFQKINDIYYYIGASALNHIRIRKVLEIANTFSLN